MNHKNALFFLALLAMLTVSSTADARTRPSQAALSGDPDAMLADGRIIAAKGEKLVARAERDLREGQELVDEGEKLTKRGNADVTRSRDDYADLSRSRGVAAEPDAVEKEAKRLLKISKKWDDALDDVRKGQKLVRKGNKKIDKARARLREGNDLVETGTLLIHNSELIRRGELILPPSG